MYKVPIEDFYHSLKQLDPGILSVVEELNAYMKAIDQSAIIANTDVKGNIVNVNDNFCEISGYRRDELIGQNHRIINSKWHDELFFKNMWKTIAGGDIWRGEIRNKKKNGSYYWVDTVIVPVLGSDQKPLNYISVRFDITQRKKDEEKILQSEKLQKDMNSYKNHLIATLSHDIRSPLRSLEGLLNIDKLDITSKDEWNEYTGDIRKRMVQCDHILNELIEWSLANFNKYDQNVKEVDLEDLVTMEVERQIPDIRKKELSVKFSIEHKGLMVTNKQVVNTVFRNILSNAIKYSFPKNEVEVRVYKSNRYVCVSVKDTGIGMDDYTRERVMSSDKFFSEGTMGERGAGLGLVICRELIESVNGMMIIESKRGEGSDICFGIPF